MNDQQLANLRERLKSDVKDDLCAYCGELIAAGVEHKDIIRAIMCSVSLCAVSDESWLPTASIINLSDSLVHVPANRGDSPFIRVADSATAE